MQTEQELPVIERLTRDLKAAAGAGRLSAEEARYLVDAYYQIQRMRIRNENQTRAAAEGAEPHALLAWFAEQSWVLESQVKRALDAYSDGPVVGLWSKTTIGIGPVLAAGLLAHIDITRAPHVGHLWSFAGLAPHIEWKKGEKRPWNARLKTLCWKIGDSFVKQSGHPEDIYGKLYLQRKAQEVERDAAGAFAEQAAASLATKRYRADTGAKRAYEAGHLPAGRLDLRARRWAVKVFLAHWWMVAYRAHYRVDGPPIYAFAHLGHADLIPVPNWPF